jgi:hypothetical protein
MPSVTAVGWLAESRGLPVVSCELAGVAHGGGDVTAGGVAYWPIQWKILSSLPTP